MRSDRNGMLTIAAGVVSIVAAVGGGVYTIETRYAHQTDLVQHVDRHEQQQKAFSAELLESRRQAIHREVFQMEEAGRKRVLTPEERRYLDELRQQERETADKMQRIQR